MTLGSGSSYPLWIRQSSGDWTRPCTPILWLWRNPEVNPRARATTKDEEEEDYSMMEGHVHPFHAATSTYVPGVATIIKSQSALRMGRGSQHLPLLTEFNEGGREQLMSKADTYCTMHVISWLMLLHAQLSIVYLNFHMIHSLR